MRADALGFFWQDMPAKKKDPKEKIKRTPPDPVWMLPDYLPGLEEARQFPIELMDWNDLEIAKQTEDRFLYDTECYHNYWCGVFRSVATGKALICEKTEANIGLSNEDMMRWIFANIVVVTFNGIHYDMPMTALSLDGVECDQLKKASDDLIVKDMFGNTLQGKDILRRHKVRKLKVDHIDLIEVAPLTGSLKAYGGRLHVPRMQDLPFHPSTILTPDQIAITRWYCVNDTTSTGFLHECLRQAIDLRTNLSNENGIDVRSKSDAQIAEAIIASEYQRLTGQRAQRPVIPKGTVYYYEKPHNLYFQSALMQSVLKVVQETPFIVGEDGSIELPAAIAALEFKIGNSTYQMGIGGLHSKEKSLAHVTDDFYQMKDLDVESYYPRLILNNGYFPEHLGPIFLQIFGAIVTRRLGAKHRGDKPTADSLKIVINGTYGKLGSVWSIVYGPKLLFHTTIGGQLYLLMLTEALEMNGIHVVSGNTDGIMVKCPRHLLERMGEIVAWWEGITNFKMDGKNYKGLYSRDINNYIAIDENLNVKHKGAYYNPWDDPKENPEFKLKKNPVTTISIVAVDEFLTKGIPVEQTIYGCKDIRKFIRTQGIKGGAVKDGDYLGGQVRWYYSTEERGKEIVRANNGHLVNSSRGGKPAMQLPLTLPDDIDHEWYIARSLKILKEIGATV